MTGKFIALGGLLFGLVLVNVPEAEAQRGPKVGQRGYATPRFNAAARRPPSIQRGTLTRRFEMKAGPRQGPVTRSFNTAAKPPKKVYKTPKAALNLNPPRM